MAGPLLPLFPLDLVLLPGAPLKLHIFEERYKEMVGDAIANSTEFGVVQASEKGILNIGCTATVQRVLERYSDGRFDILAAGRRRFEIMLVNTDKDFLQAQVDFFDDEEESSVSEEVTAAAMRSMEVLRREAEEEDEELAVRDVGGAPLSFRIAAYISDKHFRQTLLAMRSESDRLQRINEYLPMYMARTARVAHVKHVAPKNRH